MAQVTRVSTVLTNARKLIEQGWRQGPYKTVSPSGKTCFCLEGSVHEAVGGTWTGLTKRPYIGVEYDPDGAPPIKRKAMNLLDDVALKLHGGRESFYSAVGFNESRPRGTRGKRQVLALFDQAIAAARKAEQRERQRASRRGRQLADA